MIHAAGRKINFRKDKDVIPDNAVSHAPGPAFLTLRKDIKMTKKDSYRGRHSKIPILVYVLFLFLFPVMLGVWDVLDLERLKQKENEFRLAKKQSYLEQLFTSDILYIPSVSLLWNTEEENRNNIIRVLDLAVEHGFRCVMIDAKDSFGNILYDSQVPQVDEIGSRKVRFSPAWFVKECRSRSILPAVRQVVGFDPLFAERSGLPEKFVSPTNRIHQAYNVRIKKELELWFPVWFADYFRFDDDGVYASNPYKTLVLMNNYTRYRRASAIDIVNVIFLYGRTAIDWNKNCIEPTGQDLYNLSRATRTYDFVEQLKPVMKTNRLKLTPGTNEVLKIPMAYIPPDGFAIMAYPFSFAEDTYWKEPYRMTRELVRSAKGKSSRPLIWCLGAYGSKKLSDFGGSLPELLTQIYEATAEEDVHSRFFWNSSGDYADIFESIAMITSRNGKNESR
jgi:hypothetical protein